jgi:hypothetical protein
MNRKIVAAIAAFVEKCEAAMMAAIHIVDFARLVRLNNERLAAPRVPFRMSEAQWLSLRRVQGALPKEARDELDWLIDLYREHESGMKGRNPPEARRSLAAARRSLLAAVEEIESFPQEALEAMRFNKPHEEGDIVLCGIPFVVGKRDLKEQLANRLIEMKRSAEWLRIAHDRVERKRCGGDASNRKHLLRQLDLLLARHGLPKLDRRSKRAGTPLDFAAAVFQIADPDAGINRPAIEGWIKELPAWRAKAEACQN